MLATPFLVYVLSRESSALTVNESLLKMSGFDSSHEIIGKSALKVWGKTDGTFDIIANDREIIHKDKQMICEESVGFEPVNLFV